MTGERTPNLGLKMPTPSPRRRNEGRSNSPQTMKRPNLEGCVLFSFPGNEVESRPMFSSHAISSNHDIPTPAIYIHHKAWFDRCRQLAAIAVASTVARAAYTAASLYHLTSGHQHIIHLYLVDPRGYMNFCSEMVIVYEKTWGLESAHSVI